MDRLKARDGWLVLAAGVTAYELLAPPGQLLSQGVDRALESHPYTTRLAIGYLALHLLNLVPHEIDPLHQLAIRMGHEAPE